MTEKKLNPLKLKEKEFFWHGFLLGLIVGALILTFLLAITGPVSK